MSFLARSVLLRPPVCPSVRSSIAVPRRAYTDHANHGTPKRGKSNKKFVGDVSRFPNHLQSNSFHRCTSSPPRFYLVPINSLELSSDILFIVVFLMLGRDIELAYIET
ncbi:hypothetical protein BC936DRAFT_149918 [Jimgerdemannia flammicorona]|uniref:Uncharacterized protein n=1 Tax=Jimgerdemannia flammicorona TaxID=994334 RepID=A0A433CZU6_9FUNG|nr:hypothetical protein BC936DRAFT_149918 [Jimgerdemannia flammicorona]